MYPRPTVIRSLARRRLRRLTPFLVAALACACERGTANDPAAPGPTTKTSETAPRKDAHAGADKVELKTVPIVGNIYMLMGRGGNIGVSVGEDGVLIIDDQFAPHADAIRAAIGRLGQGKLEFVLNTHHHGDHTGGNAIFGKEATIVAHENLRKQLVTRKNPRESLPVITFDQSLRVHFNGEAIQAVHFPHGHTDNDSVYFFEGSNVVHMGDTFFNGRFPYVDLDSGGNPMQLLANVQAVLARVGPETRIIPGHGELARRADLETYARMLESTIASVRAQLAANKSLDQIKAAGVASEWSSWGKGYITTERWLTILHTAMTKNPSS